MTVSVIESPSPVLMCSHCTHLMSHDMEGRNWNQVLKAGSVKVFCANEDCVQHGKRGSYPLPKQRQLVL